MRWVEWGSEYHIPELCRRAVESGRSQLWGHGEVTPEQARGLLYLAEQLGCWANWDTAGYAAHQPFPIPPEHFVALDWQNA